MKIKFLFSPRSRFVGRGLLLGCAILLCASTGAQTNLLKNGLFEGPIDPEGASGTTNWVVVFAHGTAADFLYADRTTEANKPNDTNDLVTPPEVSGGYYGAAFGARHWSWAHAYHKQVVTGLTPGASYTLRGYMHCGFDNNKCNPYIAMLGGADGSTVVSNRGTTTRTLYFMTNTASDSGQIEVRVGLNQGKYAVVDAGQAKWYNGTAWFDVFSLTPTP